ncbi:hypothetical protein HYDPIDRAFT_34427 [Hydnomerulius pinastri MD-312]|uniref:Uncharacterized protein n=1 Tax=Hydnomerulius pinastri MD-312 TaxID=994086 RepID=A0A0C9W691_9AGAM|nr:hypothetical protein HYDPIDRAFT_34427 [Hydnomerulius pinastri MD-312]
MAQKKRVEPPRKDLDDDSSGDSSSSVSSSESRTTSSTKKQPKKRSKSKKKGKNAKGSKTPSPAGLGDGEASDDVHEEFLAAARAITRCVDMCCKVDDVINIALLLEQEEAAKSGELTEEDAIMTARTTRLASISTKSRERYMRTYQQLLYLAPGFKNVIGDPKKANELTTITGKMTGMIKTTRSNDASRLGGKIAVYAAPDPSKEAITPPIATGSGGRSHLGLNHPVLARFIIPIDYLKLYDEDPVSTRKKLESGELAFGAYSFPAVLWPGNPPGADYCEEKMEDGFFRGYLLVRVMRHIFLGPSTAMGHVSRATRTCNAVLHDMTMVEPEHIAYGCVQTRFIISSMNQWNENDGPFNYRVFYYNVISFIRDCHDKEWAADLLKWWNVQLFKNENGRNADHSSDDEDNIEVVEGSSTSRPSETSTFAKMQAQMKARMAAKQAPPLKEPTENPPPRGPTPLPPPPPPPPPSPPATSPPPIKSPSRNPSRAPSPLSELAETEDEPIKEKKSKSKSKSKESTKSKGKKRCAVADETEEMEEISSRRSKRARK